MSFCPNDSTPLINCYLFLLNQSVIRSLYTIKPIERFIWFSIRTVLIQSQSWAFDTLTVSCHAHFSHQIFPNRKYKCKRCGATDSTASKYVCSMCLGVTLTLNEKCIDPWKCDVIHIVKKKKNNGRFHMNSVDLNKIHSNRNRKQFLPVVCFLSPLVNISLLLLFLFNRSPNSSLFHTHIATCFILLQRIEIPWCRVKYYTGSAHTGQKETNRRKKKKKKKCV